jgi:PPK2 family polyphosphate:nucleotide phosphotransferase
MDACGKDSTIKHVMSGVNPQSCEVHAFKSPSAEEREHDFLWRTTVRLPRRGHIGIFNRSYYEEVLVVRVHPELLEGQQLPKQLVKTHLWRDRYDDIVAHERHLTRNGTAVVKVFLNLSKEEQRHRLLKRIDEPPKRWKLTLQDTQERQRWKDYMGAYEQMIRKTSTDEAPWHVVPADRKWWARAVVGAILLDTMEGIHVDYPKTTPAKRRELKQVAAALRPPHRHGAGGK